MGDFAVTRGATSQIFTIALYDNSSTTGALLSGILYTSTNLTIEMRRAFSSSVTSYSGANIETIATLGTFAAPSSSSKIRFKETTMTGVYEVQVHDSATNGFGSGDASPYVDVKVYEATTSALKIAVAPLKIPLTAFDFQTAAGSAPSVSAIRIEMDTNSTKLAHLDADVTTRLAPTVAGRTLDVATTGEAGLDFDNIKDATGAHTLTNIRVPNVTLIDTLTTYTGNTPQTGDNYSFANRVVIRGTVSATAPTTGSFTCAALDVAGSAADQFKGRILIFDKTTTTTALRGQASDILTSSVATLPLLTFTTMTTAAVSGDSFSIV
jgi:hypothetical protein